MGISKFYKNGLEVRFFRAKVTSHIQVIFRIEEEDKPHLDKFTGVFHVRPIMDRNDKCIVVKGANLIERNRAVIELRIDEIVDWEGISCIQCRVMPYGMGQCHDYEFVQPGEPQASGLESYVMY